MTLIYTKTVIGGVITQKQYTNLPVTAPDTVVITQAEYEAIPVLDGFDPGGGGDPEAGDGEGGPGGIGGGEPE